MTDAYRRFSALMGSGKYREAAELAAEELAKGQGAGAFWLTRKASALNRALDHEQAWVDSRAALAVEPSNPYAILQAAPESETTCPTLLPRLDELRTYCYEHQIEEIPVLLAV